LGSTNSRQVNPAEKIMKRSEGHLLDTKCPNPDCLAPLGLSYADILHHMKAQCARCGSEVHFEAPSVAEFRSALHQYRYLKDRVAAAQRNVMETARVVVKNPPERTVDQ
jgi:hypothetical protein